MSPAFIILDEELPAVLSLAATLMYWPCKGGRMRKISQGRNDR